MTKSNSLCPRCRAAVPSGAKFCVQCGARIGAPARCPNCQAAVPPGSRFCVHCGGALFVDPRSEMTAGNRWMRRAGEFAHRFEVSDLKGVLSKGITIEEGTRGMFFQQGQMVGILGPGFHTLETLSDRLSHFFTSPLEDVVRSPLKTIFQRLISSPCTVVLVDVGEVSLDVGIGAEERKLRTKDDQTVGLAVRLLVALENPMDFYVNYMRGQERVANDEVASRIMDEMVSVLQSTIIECAADELYGNRKLIQRIEDELRHGLRNSFGRLGLVFHRVEFVDFSGNVYDEIRRRRGEIRIDEERHQVEQERAKVDQKLRELFNQDRMNAIRSEADFYDFIKQVEHEAGVKALLRQQDREELWREFAAGREDYELAREHLLKKLDWQRKREQLAAEFEYKRDLLAKRHELTHAERAHQLQTMEEEHRAELEREYRRHHADLEKLRETRQVDLVHESAVFDQQLERDRREAELAMDAAQRWQDLKQAGIDAAIQRELERKRGEKDIRVAEQREQHEMELEKLQALSSLSAEALIAASPTDQARLLAELKQTEAMKGLSEEQILAIAAKDSDAVARAFEEKFRAAGSQAVYERMLAEQKESARQLAEAHKDSAQQMAEFHRENAKMLKELMETALETQRDTGVAAAQSQGPSVVFPPPGSGAATIVSSSAPTSPAAPSMVDCPQCRQKSPAGSQFCGNCGFRFA